ncbi:MAG: ribonuclease III [Nitrospinales bacterium]
MLSKKRLQRLTLLQETLGYFFKDINLLNKALTHKSFVNERNRAIKNNERFEFLGDSVLDLIVSEFTVKQYAGHREGELSKIRAAVVNESRLARLAREIGLGDLLLLGKGEEISGGRAKVSLLANSFEALAGAIYFDGGLENARRAFLPLLRDEIENYAETRDFQDFKSDLQEYTQNKFNCIPSYKVIRETGPDHSKTFEVTVQIKNEVWGTGKGHSKKEAEQAAAQDAFQSFNMEIASGKLG